jgi:fatty acid desaturase
MKTSTISIGLTVHTKDEAVGMAADDTTSVEEATMAMAIIAVATVAIATMAWATVAMATMAATIITVAQTREAYGEATVEEAEEDTKAFNKRNATSVTNRDAGSTSIP